MSPIGVLREDARPDDNTGGPGSSPAFLMKDHMDRYAIDYAVLTGSGMLSLSLHNDPDYGNTLSSALNEWLVATWLAFSPRFRGSIIINHSDPAYAAREIRNGARIRRFPKSSVASGSNRLFGNGFSIRSTRPPPRWACPSRSTPAAKAPAPHPMSHRPAGPRATWSGTIFSR